MYRTQKGLTLTETMIVITALILLGLALFISINTRNVVFWLKDSNNTEIRATSGDFLVVEENGSSPASQSAKLVPGIYKIGKVNCPKSKKYVEFIPRGAGESIWFDFGALSHFTMGHTKFEVITADNPMHLATQEDFKK